MKKLYVCFVILLAGAVSLWADLSRQPRLFELGFSGGGGIANNYISAAEIFQETIEIDVTGEPRPIIFDFDADFNFFINLNLPGDIMGFGLFTGVEALGQFNLSEHLQEFLQGNKLNKTYAGDIGIGGSAFLEVGAHGYFNVKKFKISVRPAYYFPVAYMKPDAHYSLRTGSAGDVYVDFEYDFAIYTPFEMGDDLSSIKLDPSKISGQGGFDITAGVDYPLLDYLSVGATITHIPLFPARLMNKTVIKGGKSLESEDLLNELINGGNLEDLLKDKTVESSHGDIQIFRPFKIGLNAVYSPLKFSLLSVDLIPQLGYAYNEIYVKPHSLEGALTARVGFINKMRSNALLALTVRSGYEDKVWRQQVGVTLNFRIIQLDVGVASQSENFAKSFAGAGLGVNLGLRFGW